MGWVSALIRDESAQDLAEYAMALAVISATVGLLSLAIGANVNTLWDGGLTIIRSVTDAL